jgi:hypothetical protein
MSRSYAESCSADQDIDAALADVDSEVVLDWSNSDAPDGGVYTGHAGLRAFVQARDEALEERRLDFAQVIAASKSRRESRSSGRCARGRSSA